MERKNTGITLGKSNGLVKKPYSKSIPNQTTRREERDDSFIPFYSGGSGFSRGRDTVESDSFNQGSSGGGGASDSFDSDSGGSDDN